MRSVFPPMPQPGTPAPRPPTADGPVALFVLVGVAAFIGVIAALLFMHQSEPGGLTYVTAAGLLSAVAYEARRGRDDEARRAHARDRL